MGQHGTEKLQFENAEQNDQDWPSRCWGICTHLMGVGMHCQNLVWFAGHEFRLPKMGNKNDQMHPNTM
jgi:hypothetical protein